MKTPMWLALLSPLPPDAVPERKPVASAEQTATGTAGPTAGWENVTVNLSDPAVGTRHLQLTLDASGTLIAASDHGMFVRDMTPGEGEVTISDHESIGGRFEADGSFRGTCWHTRLTQVAGSDDEPQSLSTSSAPSRDEVDALGRLAAEVLLRANRG